MCGEDLIDEILGGEWIDDDRGEIFEEEWTEDNNCGEDTGFTGDLTGVCFPGVLDDLFGV